MKNIERVSLETVQAHERKTGANMTLGGYHMSDFVPINEIECYRVLFETSDLSRLHMIVQFQKYTLPLTTKLEHLRTDETTFSDKVRQRIGEGVDLVACEGEELTIVGTNLNVAPLMIYDGHHRAIGHFFRTRSVEGVPAYVCVHPNMSKWNWTAHMYR